MQHPEDHPAAHVSCRPGVSGGETKESQACIDFHEGLEYPCSLI
jgi:hypothetical protein